MAASKAYLSEKGSRCSVLETLYMYTTKYSVHACCQAEVTLHVEIPLSRGALSQGFQEVEEQLVPFGRVVQVAGVGAVGEDL